MDSTINERIESKKPSPSRVLVAGGGSGGHVFPGLAVALELRRRGWSVSWVGRPDGMERRLVEAAGVSYAGLPSRAVMGTGPAARLRALLSLAVSSVRARILIGRLQPRVVLGTGGYASAPAVLGAALASCPIVLLEPNATPGAANRWLSRWARAAAVANRSTGERLRCPVVDTGVPVRAQFSMASSEPCNEGALSLLVLGGSQGARMLNDLLPPALGRLQPERPVTVVHQVGETHLAAAREAYAAEGLGSIEVEIVSFIEDMPAAIAASDLVISRAGAVTLAEICAVGRAALLVPLDLAGSHQVANAERLVAGGGARMLLSEQLAVGTLATELEKLMRDKVGLAAMGKANRGLGRPDATSRVADLVQQAAEES